MKLLQLVVVTGFALIAIGGGSALSVGACTPAQVQEMSERNAKTYAAKMGIKYTGMNCSTTDSDGDGYVSCDLNTPTGIVSIECALWGSGCKAKPSLQVGSR